MLGLRQRHQRDAWALRLPTPRTHRPPAHGYLPRTHLLLQILRRGILRFTPASLQDPQGRNRKAHQRRSQNSSNSNKPQKPHQGPIRRACSKRRGIAKALINIRISYPRRATAASTPWPHERSAETHPALKNEGQDGLLLLPRTREVAGQPSADRVAIPIWAVKRRRPGPTIWSSNISATSNKFLKVIGYQPQMIFHE